MPSVVLRPRRRSLLLPVAVVVAALFAGSALPAAGAHPPGFRTARAAMLTTSIPGASVLPIISVLDTVGGYQFQGIPDGIALSHGHGGSADVYVNHETSKVPFPLVPLTADARNAEVSHLSLNRAAEVLSGEIVIGSALGFQRFCSNFIAGHEQGFKHEILFTNEETSDFVLRQENSWPATATEPPSVQAGQVVALDIETGDWRVIPKLGRMNHENAVALPSFKQVAIVTGDDTFSAPSSQFYMYVAQDGDAVWNDEGHLWAFKTDITVVNDYGDLLSGESVSGHFVAVPDAIAAGVPGDAATGPQGALETWSNTNNVFQFIRVEDIAYDRQHPNILYIADTGEPRAVPATGANTARLTRGPSSFRGPYMNGRIWKMVLDPKDPTIVESLSILPNANFDLGGYSNPNVPHQPDNVETVRGGLLFTEDPGTHNTSADATFANATNARLWFYDFDTESLTVVAQVDQSQDPAAAHGAWESSGIVDASDWFGDGAFLINVQAHTRTTGPLSAKTEDGQLLLLRLPRKMLK